MPFFVLSVLLSLTHLYMAFHGDTCLCKSVHTVLSYSHMMLLDELAICDWESTLKIWFPSLLLTEYELDKYVYLFSIYFWGGLFTTFRITCL